MPGIKDQLVQMTQDIARSLIDDPSRLSMSARLRNEVWPKVTIGGRVMKMSAGMDYDVTQESSKPYAPHSARIQTEGEIERVEILSQVSQPVSSWDTDRIVRVSLQPLRLQGLVLGTFEVHLNDDDTGIAQISTPDGCHVDLAVETAFDRVKVVGGRIKAPEKVCINLSDRLGHIHHGEKPPDSDGLIMNTCGVELAYCEDVSSPLLRSGIMIRTPRTQALFFHTQGIGTSAVVVDERGTQMMVHIPPPIKVLGRLKRRQIGVDIIEDSQIDPFSGQSTYLIQKFLPEGH